MEQGRVWMLGKEKTRLGKWKTQRMQRSELIWNQKCLRQQRRQENFRYGNEVEICWLGLLVLQVQRKASRVIVRKRRVERDENDNDRMRFAVMQHVNVVRRETKKVSSPSDSII
jgi:hypothetical protein